MAAIIRLSQARAKLELREEVTANDANDVVEIMKESLYDVFTDEHGHLDFRRGSGMSKSKQTSVFMKALHKVSNMFCVCLNRGERR